MRTILILLLFQPFWLLAQNPVQFDEAHIYVVTRATKTKQFVIARDFNIKDTLSTHVGIGLVENGKFIVYNVSNVEINENNSALIREEFASFTNVRDIKHAAIWSIGRTPRQMRKFRKTLDDYKSKVIVFDDDFCFDNGDALYCSEFVEQLLGKAGPDLHFKPETKQLNQFYSMALHRDVMEYFPVDFFQRSEKFTRIYEHFYSLAAQQTEDLATKQ